MAKKPEQNPAAKKAAWTKASTDAKATWKSARKAKAGSFEEAEIEDGTYRAQLIDAKADVTKKGQPYTNLTFVVLDDPYTGDKHRRADFLTDDDEQRQAQKLEGFSKTMSGLGYDVSELEMSEIPDLIEDVKKDKPFVEIYVRAWQGERSHGISIYVNRLLTDEEIEEVKDAVEEEGDDEPEKAPKKSAPKKKAAPKKKKAGGR